jgi:hypothetical protein
MTARRANVLVGAALLLAGTAAAVAVSFLLLNRATGRHDSIFAFTDVAQNLPPTLAFLLVGALISTRRPENPIGWLCLLYGLFGFLAWGSEQYAAYAAVTHPGSLPGGLEIAVAVNGFWVPLVATLVLVTLLFPTGRFLTARWRIPAWLTGAGLGALYAVAITLGLDAPFQKLDNPLKLGGNAAGGVVVGLGIAAALSGVFGAFASVVTRFRRSRGVEREQMKWLVFAAALVPIALVAHSIADSFAPGARGTIEAFFGFVVLAFPAAIGIAILRYRLYEIDRIISRTLVYGALTAILAAAYAGLVIAGQALFSSFAGGSNLVIAISTLLVAALFMPLRRRIQCFVDRRFYRRRYDAARTLERFSSRLRQEVDLDVLNNDLVGVVRETMEPARISLWLAR